MYKHVQEQFCQALRSGEYRQGGGALKNLDGGYCCLGVLTDLYNKATGADHQLSGRGLPNIEVAEWAGLSAAVLYTRLNHDLNTFIFNINLNGSTVSAINDAGVPFTQIADLIEKHIQTVDVNDIADTDNTREPAPISTEQLEGYLVPAKALV